ncbi:MAG: hypothetical protein KDB79_14590 [Acidobacteria bacterium]|nr:hypothetical protein [Acidobacteriota bacterium]
MKKLLSIAFIAVISIFGAAAANAQTGRNSRNINHRQNVNFNPVIRTYTQTKNVVIGKKHFRDTYQVSVFRNGKSTSKLVSRVEIKNKKNNYFKPAVQTKYQTVIVREHGKTYRVTSKIMKYRNGKTVKQIASKVRVR